MPPVFMSEIVNTVYASSKLYGRLRLHPWMLCATLPLACPWSLLVEVRWCLLAPSSSAAWPVRRRPVPAEFVREARSALLVCRVSEARRRAALDRILCAG